MAGMSVFVLRGNWPVPSESPACLKLLTWLQMAGIEHEVVHLSGPPKSKTGKAPYVTRPDGSILDDSHVIIEALTEQHGIELDAHRTPQQRAAMTMLQRTVECHMYFGGLLHRWRDNWSATRDAYFKGRVPAPVLWMAGPIIRRNALAQAKGQGLGRRPPEQVHAEIATDLEALATVLGDDEFYFGSPGVTDAIVYGALENARACPLDGQVKQIVTQSPTWMAYLDRIKTRYWSDAEV